MKTPIKLNDLRIGNVLNYQTDEGIQPSAIDWQDLKWLTEDPEDFNAKHSGIPITEDWLETFGFSDKDYKDGYIGIEFESGNVILDFVLCRPFTKGKWNKNYTFDLNDHRFSALEYVHELQNLFYALTGEELKW